MSILALRNETERIEGIKAGFSKLIGTDTAIIISETKNMLTNLKKFKSIKKLVKNPYGDGESAVKIENIMWRILNE